MKRSEKEHIITEVAEIVGRASGMYFTDFKGLTVEEVTELRRDFQKSGIDYKVVKNTLIKKALEAAGGFDRVLGSLSGPTGIAFAFDDPTVPAKVIKKFTDKFKKLSLKSCVLEKQYYEGANLGMLAKMPGKKEMMSGIVGSIGAPLAGVPTVIHSVMQELVSVVDQIAQKKAA